MEQQSTKERLAERWQQIGAVMVVDDDDNWCFVSKKILKKAGFLNQVIVASNGLVALNKLRELAASGEKLPDLIFLDIKMPVLDGFGFLDEITESQDLDLSKTKIYICSSSFLPKDKQRATRYAVSGFITKPLTLANLNDIVQ